MTATLPTISESWSGTIQHGTYSTSGDLPVRPVGYQMLISLPPKQEKAGALFIPEDRRDIDYRRSIVVQVVAMGEQCYVPDRYPRGPWCRIGDWVMIPSYAGSSSFKIKGHDSEYRIINEDQILAVVTGPDQVERV